MIVKDVLLIWDRFFPNNVYPAAWVIRMWCHRYTAQEFEHAAQVTIIAAEEGRLRKPNDDVALSCYLSGVLRQAKVDSAEVDAEIEKHIAKRGGDAYISI